jgi:hypothetical protein
MTRFQPLADYPIDPRTGEGPQAWLGWTDALGVAHQEIGVGFLHWNDRTRREELLFAVHGRVNRRVSHFAFLAASRGPPCQPAGASCANARAD